MKQFLCPILGRVASSQDNRRGLRQPIRDNVATGAEFAFFKRPALAFLTFFD